MVVLSVSDVAIRNANAAGSLVIEERESRLLSEPFWSIEDAHGVIEVALSPEEAKSIVERALQ